MNIGLVYYCAGSLGFCDIYISSAGNSLAEGENALYFRFMYVVRVLISSRDCSRDVRILFFLVGSVGRVKFGAI